ncbi:MAG: LysR family transcriptional regulator [Coprococcus sp.]
MEISYIDEFIALADTKKYSAAARRLHIAQPTLTRHIQAMEDELGCILFTRTTREISLSGYGKIFLPYAKKISDEFHKAKMHMESYEQQTNQKLQIGIVHNPDLYHIIDFIMDFQHSHPDIPFHFIEAPLYELHAEFLSGHLNIVTLTYAYWENIPDNFIIGGESRLVAVLPEDHPLAKQEKISLSSLKNAKLIVPEKQNYVYRYLEHVLKTENIQPDIFYQGNTSGISNLLKKHMGILIQDYHHAELQLDTPLILRELEPDISFVFGFEYKNVLTKNERIFIQYARKKLKKQQ